DTRGPGTEPSQKRGQQKMTAVSDSEISTPLLIGGQGRRTTETFPVYDPAHAGQVIGQAAAATARDALDAVAAAHPAWPAGAALPAAERAAIALKPLDGLEADADERTDILSRENGKVRA